MWGVDDAAAAAAAAKDDDDDDGQRSIRPSDCIAFDVLCCGAT